MSAPSETHNLRGIALMVAAMAGFAIEDIFLKRAAMALPTGEIMLLTDLVIFTFFAILTRARGRRLVERTIAHPLVLARLAGEALAALGYLTALAVVPLPMVSAVLQAAPLAMTLGAALVMGEAVGWRRWSAVVIGFLGVIVVVRPGLAGFTPAVLWVILSVAAIALRDLASRRLPAQIATTQVATWSVAAGVAMGAVLMAGHGWVTPDRSGWISLAGSTIFGAAGYLAITAATRIGEASVIAPYRYVRLVFVLALALPLLGEVPDAMTLLGAALIVGSGLYTLARERLKRRSALSTVTNPG